MINRTFIKRKKQPRDFYYQLQDDQKQSWGTLGGQSGMAVL